MATDAAALPLAGSCLAPIADTSPSAAPAVDAPPAPVFAPDDEVVEAVTEESGKKGSKLNGPGGKHDNMRVYDADEAARVHKLIEQHKPRWTYIAERLTVETGQQRTAASVRNYYKRFCESKKIADAAVGDKKLNRCQRCGQIKRGHICVAANVDTSPAKTAKTLVGGAALVGPSADSPLREAAAMIAMSEQAPMPDPVIGRSPLALTSKDDEPMPPLAAASLAYDDTASLASGTSPFSAFSAGLPSASALSLLGSPGSLASPTALAAMGLPPGSAGMGGLLSSYFANKASAAGYHPRQPFATSRPNAEEVDEQSGPSDAETQAEVQAAA